MSSFIANLLLMQCAIMYVDVCYAHDNFSTVNLCVMLEHKKGILIVVLSYFDPSLNMYSSYSHDGLLMFCVKFCVYFSVLSSQF